MRLIDLSPDLILTTDTGIVETSGILERYFAAVSNAEPLAPVYVVDGRVMTARASYLGEQEKLLRELDLGSTSATDSFLKGRIFMDHVQVPMTYARETFRKRVESLEQMTKDTPWFLLDGNHRALAYSLAKKDVPCRVLESDADLQEVRARSEALEWPQLYAEGDTLLQVVRAWEEYVLSTASSRFGVHEPRTCSIAERRDWLFEREFMPVAIVDAIKKSRQ